MPSKWKRFRSKVVKVLDNYYFKELEPEELKKALDKAIIVRHDIHSLSDLS
jgi:hypothetical protein